MQAIAAAPNPAGTGAAPREAEADMGSKTYRLLGADGAPYDSSTPGTLGGNSRDRIYGQLDCASARRAIAAGGPYVKNRVFFADEAAAIAAGYRPCGDCMRPRHAEWKRGPGGGPEYPWRVAPRNS